MYVGIDYSGNFTNEWGRTYTPVEPGTNSNVWKLQKANSYEIFDAILADDIHVVTVRNYNKLSESNIIVDWGDGTIDKVKDLPLTNPANPTDPKELFAANPDVKTLMDFQNAEVDVKEHFIGLAHKYTIPTGQDRAVYTIKIYGDYWGIIHTEKSKFKPHNLVSRVMDWDLPVSDSVLTLSNGFEGAKRLFAFGPNEYSRTPSSCINYYRIFKDCTNLQLISASHKGGSIFYNTNPVNASGMFENCVHVTSVEEFRPPIYIDEGATATTGLWKIIGIPNKDVEADILKLLPRGGFVNKYLNCQSGFANMTKLTCSNYDILAAIFWKNPGYVGTNCFKGSSLDLTKIPASWGGTGPELDTMSRSAFKTILTPLSDVEDAEDVKELIDTIKEVGDNANSL